MSVRPPVDLESLARVAADEVQLLWVNDWYDGPLEAVVRHAGVTCLMVLHDERQLTDGDAHRWILYRLDAAQRADEEKWHALYAHHVGEHWCFHPDAPHAADPSPRDPESFFVAQRARPSPELSAADALGWLDRMPTT